MDDNIIQLFGDDNDLFGKVSMEIAEHIADSKELEDTCVTYIGAGGILNNGPLFGGRRPTCASPSVFVSSIWMSSTTLKILPLSGNLRRRPPQLLCCAFAAMFFQEQPSLQTVIDAGLISCRYIFH